MSITKWYKLSYKRENNPDTSFAFYDVSSMEEICGILTKNLIKFNYGPVI